MIWILLLKEECEKYFKLALTQIPICYACLASSHLTQAFPNPSRQMKLFCSLKKMLIFRGLFSLKHPKQRLFCMETGPHTQVLDALLWSNHDLHSHTKPLAFCPNSYEWNKQLGNITGFSIISNSPSKNSTCPGWALLWRSAKFQQLSQFPVSAQPVPHLKLYNYRNEKEIHKETDTHTYTTYGFRGEWWFHACEEGRRICRVTPGFLPGLNMLYCGMRSADWL